ncbi:hypothetical protein GCM10010170_000690 [Dactylosporangium salmoneum]|uniref:Uncharacterized protein n=1 Tax=Dactylosporangium salmoneum TaxID=53361 RepID=A0ABP5S931_9ACTN
MRLYRRSHIRAAPGELLGGGAMRVGKTEVRPLGGGLGCLLMILISPALSAICTLALNLLLR